MLLLEPETERSLEGTPPVVGEMPLWARVLMARARPDRRRYAGDLGAL